MPCPEQNFMVQTGDPTNTGRGGESIYGYAQRFPASSSYHSRYFWLGRDVSLECISRHLSWLSKFVIDPFFYLADGYSLLVHALTEVVLFLCLQGQVRR